MHYFSCSGGTGVDSRKSLLGQVMLNLFFASGVICGLRNAFWSVQAVRRQCSPCHARVGPIRIPQKVCETRLTKLVFLHPV
jgi:hypothetical protein